MLLLVTCKYCGFTIEKDFYNKERVNSYKCEKCGDSNLTVKEASKEKIDTYAGCPEFPKPKKDNYEDYL